VVEGVAAGEEYLCELVIVICRHSWAGRRFGHDEEVVDVLDGGVERVSRWCWRMSGSDRLIDWAWWAYLATLARFGVQVALVLETKSGLPCNLIDEGSGIRMGQDCGGTRLVNGLKTGGDAASYLCSRSSESLRWHESDLAAVRRAKSVEAEDEWRESTRNERQ
jgi:hypothetical protein